MLEKELELKLKKEVRKRRGLFYKFTSPGQSGVPDRICILPTGKLYFIELKKPKTGRLSKLQRFQQKRLKIQKQEVRNIQNVEELKAFLKEVDLGCI